MEQKRLIGGVVGLLFLVGVFFLQFINYLGSLYSVVYDSLTDPGSFPATSAGAYNPNEYIMFAAFFLLVIAGLLGVWPKISGILGIIGSIALAVDGYLPLTINGAYYSVGDYGAGLYLVLVASIVLLVVGFFLPSKRQMVPTSMPPQPMAAPPQSMAAPSYSPAPQQPAIQGARFCPSCGQPVGGGSRFCMNCGASLV